MSTTPQHLVFVIGAGPAGLYATKKLAEAGVRVVLLNRDIKPGGLVEYGIFPTKHAMKEGLRKQFRKMLTEPLVSYFGNVRVAQNASVQLSELENLSPSAIVVAAGAQGTKSLEIPGMDATGVIHAKDLVYHYNGLPPFSQKEFPIGKKLGIIGLGNVMADITNFASNLAGVPEVLAMGRRGPAERKYTAPEFHHFAEHFDRKGFRAEIDRIKPQLVAVGQDPEKLFQEIVSATPENAPVGKTKFNFRFLVSPKEILKDSNGRIRALKVEKNLLYKKGEEVRDKASGEFEEIPLDTLVFAIGDLVDDALGLPYDRGLFQTNPNPDPNHPDFHRYQAYDPKSQKLLPGKFLIGWARKASEGVVGKTRQDAEKGVDAVLTYLKERPTNTASEIETTVKNLETLLQRPGNRPVPYSDIQKLEAIEQKEAAARKLEEFKFSKNEDMLRAIQGNNKN